MHKVTSKDGTTIAFDRAGSGPTLILTAGAFSYRGFSWLVELSSLLAKDFTVINYDRRGRGDSTDNAPYAIDREIEDLQALIDDNGGSAYVWGLSSGAVLALRAAAAGLNIKKLALFEPPFAVDETAIIPPGDWVQRLTELVAAADRPGAIKYMMTKGMGAPGFVVTMMRIMPVWSKLVAVANTLPYDAAMLDGYLTGKPLTPEQWAAVTVPTLVLAGSKSPAALRNAAQGLAAVLSDAQHISMAGQSHRKLAMNLLAPLLAEFFTS
jgi:pimeloyl-ACP methyl ester carboxylesterase